MQTTAIRTVANPLPENEIILLTLLISKRYIPYTDLLKKIVNFTHSRPQFKFFTTFAVPKEVRPRRTFEEDYTTIRAIRHISIIEVR